MQVPTMIETAHQRMLDMVVMQFPGAMNDRAIFVSLFLRQRCALRRAMWPDGHDVRRAVRQPEASAGKRNLHHVLRKVTSRMHHVLMRGGDATTGGVVVSAKVSRGAATARGLQKQREVD